MPCILGRYPDLPNNGKTNTYIMPNPCSFLGPRDGDVFAALPGEVDTLANRPPNHLFIHPRIFAKADDPPKMRSK